MRTERLLSIFAALALTVAVADGSADSITGTWKLTIEGPGGKRQAVLILGQEQDGTLSGLWRAQRADSLLHDIEYRDGVLRFAFDFIPEPGNPRKHVMRYSGRLEGSELVGRLTTPQSDLTVRGARMEPQEAPSP